MVHFAINGIAYNCNQSNGDCANKAQTCRDCIRIRLKELGFETTANFNVFEVASNERNLEMEREFIWHKFLDVLNIKHIIIIDKESGLALLNIPVSSVDLEVETLSGFIQANITFSESNKVSNSHKDQQVEHPFYEFQYKDFNILLKNGAFVRLCFILDHKASIHMRTNFEEFLINFENQFSDRFIKVRETGQFQSSGLIENIIQAFDIALVFPMTLAHAIPPEVLEKINLNPIQKVIYTIVNETLSSKPFFYINALLEKVNKIMDFGLKVVLYEIYNLFIEKVIITIPLETIVSNLDNQQQQNEIKDEEIKVISSIVVNDKDFIDFTESISTMDELTGKEFLKELVKKGKSLEKTLNYQSAVKEYKKAFFLAKKFNLNDEQNKIAQMIFDIDKRSEEIELNFCIEMGENAEKNKDYLNSIHHYQKAVKILEGFLIYDQNDQGIKKLKKKIQKIRELI